MCEKLYNPGRNIALDEQVIKTKSNYCSFKVRFAEKPIKCGIKVLSMNDKKSGGYTWAFSIYDGNIPKFQGEEGLWASCGPMYKKLSEHAEWHICTQDNWFNTMKVSKLMYKNKVYVRGTGRPGRFFEIYKN